MRETKVLELKTKKEVEQFCNLLMRLKDEAPKSLSFTVAVTVEQSTEIVIPQGASYTRAGHIERELAKLEYPKFKVEVKRTNNKPKYKRRAIPATYVIEE
jgi:hypothetical protein